jgi:hypothetical protein
MSYLTEKADAMFNLGLVESAANRTALSAWGALGYIFWD